MTALFCLAFLLAAPEPDAGEGFVVVNSDAPVQVTKLHDEGGGAEKPPSWMLQILAGPWHVDFLAAAPGGTLQAGVFWRPAGDWWLGTRLSGAAAPRPHDSPALWNGSAAVEVRQHFLLHPEANRFVMGHVAAGAGASFLDAGSDTLAGPFAFIGAGVGVALSYDRYLGLEVSYAFPVWVRNDTHPREYASFLSVGLFLTQGF